MKAGTSARAAAHRRRVFVEHFVSSGNATAAARAAGFSAKTADQQGARLLKDVRVSASIKRRQAALADRYKLKAENVTRSLAQALYFDPRKLYREDGTLKAVQELDEDTAMALTGVEVVITTNKDGSVATTRKLKWLDKNTAREQAMKHLGLFKEDNAQRTDPIRELLELVNGAKGSRGIDHVKDRR